MALSSLEQAIILTISYPDQFSYPLTMSEIWQRLIKQVGEWWLVLPREVTQKQVAKTLKILLGKKIIETDGTLYWLRGRSFLSDRRQRRQRMSQGKWLEVDRAVAFAEKIPWVSAVFITGSLAMNNVDQDDDTDFMIVTQANRLWLTRLCLSLYAMALGKRRSWHGEEKRSWCFNLWLEEPALSILGEEHSLYRAYELLQAKVAFDRTGVAKQLRLTNQWLREFLPNAAWSGGRTVTSGFPQETWLSRLTSRLNTIAFELQFWYMAGHMTRERVTKTYAFFHPRDTQGWIIDNWIKSLTNQIDNVA